MSWDELNIRQKYDLMQAAKGSYTGLNELKQAYNEYSLGGNMDRMWSKVRGYYNRLTAAGIPANAALGIIGNIAQESSGNPNAHTDGTSFYGLTQNHYTIRDMIARRYGNYSANSQIQFIIDGWHNRLKGMPQWLQNRFSDYRSSVTKETTPYQSALNWNKYYERAVGQQDNKRGGYAAGFAKYVRNIGVNNRGEVDYNTAMNTPNLTSDMPEQTLSEVVVKPEDTLTGSVFKTDLIPDSYYNNSNTTTNSNNNNILTDNIVQNKPDNTNYMDDYDSYIDDLKALNRARNERINARNNGFT